MAVIHQGNEGAQVTFPGIEPRRLAIRQGFLSRSEAIQRLAVSKDVAKKQRVCGSFVTTAAPAIAAGSLECDRVKTADDLDSMEPGELRTHPSGCGGVQAFSSCSNTAGALCRDRRAGNFFAGGFGVHSRLVVFA